MPPEAIGAALLSAVVHAAWNVVLKGGSDRFAAVGAMGIGGIAFGLAGMARTASGRVRAVSGRKRGRLTARADHALLRAPTWIGAQAAALRGNWLRFAGAGMASNAGFGLALGAQAIAPIVYVTRLRETSVVFGAAVASWVLREPVSRRRRLEAIVVAIGGAVPVVQR